MVFKCSKCGSTNVGLDISINPNDNATIRNQCITNTSDDEEGYCNQCRDMCRIIRDENADTFLPEPDLFADWQQGRQDAFILSIHDYNTETKNVTHTLKVFYALYRAKDYFSWYAENEIKDGKEHYLQYTVFDYEIPVEARKEFNNHKNLLENLDQKRLHPVCRKSIAVCDLLDAIQKYLPGYPNRKEVLRFRELRLFIDGVITLNEAISRQSAEEEAFKLTMDMYMEALPYCQQKCVEYFRRIKYPDLPQEDQK